MPAPTAPLDKLKEQLKELDALMAEGVLTGTAARAARDDLERQVLEAVLGKVPVAPTPAAAAAADTARTAAAVAGPRPSRGLVAAVAAFVLVFGGVGYGWLGNRAGWRVGPGDTGAAAADAEGHGPEAAQIEAMITRLAERLKAQPDDAQGWAMLGRSYTARARYKEALAAYKRAFDLQPQNAQAMVDYADGMAVLNNRSLEGEPTRLILQAVKLDPTNVKALALAGTVAFDRGEFPAAVDYWERAVQASDPDSEIRKQLQGALAEARQRGGMPAAPADPSSPSAPAPSVFAAAPPDANAPAGTSTAAGATVTGRVTLKASLQGQVEPDSTVFIFARAPSGSRMPLAILRKKVSDLPFDFKLDDSLAMSPAARLSSAQQVVVGARISKSGNAMPQPGDLQVLSDPVAVGAQGLKLEIAQAVR